MAMYSTVIQTREELVKYARVIHGCLSQMTESYGQYHPVWMQVWFDQFDFLTPFIILVFDSQHTLLGFLPLQKNSKARGLFQRGLTRMELVTTYPEMIDSSDIPILETVDREAVLGVMGETLLRYQSEWQILALRFIRTRADLVSLSRTWPNSFLKITDDMPYFAMPAASTPSEYDEAMKPCKRRRNLNPNFRDTQALGRQCYLPNTIQAFSESLKQTVGDLKAPHPWKAYPQMPRVVARVYEQLSEQKEKPLFHLHLSEGLISTGRLASAFGVINPHELSCMVLTTNPSMSHHRPGLIHADDVFRAYIGQVKTLNMGRGDFDYKHRYWPLVACETFQLYQASSLFSWACRQLDLKLKTNI
jgi:hypothetical protein